MVSIKNKLLSLNQLSSDEIISKLKLYQNDKDEVVTFLATKVSDIESLNKIILKKIYMQRSLAKQKQLFETDIKKILTVLDNLKNKKDVPLDEKQKLSVVTEDFKSLNEDISYDYINNTQEYIDSFEQKVSKLKSVLVSISQKIEKK